jgi:hypothetical protein
MSSTCSPCQSGEWPTKVYSETFRHGHRWEGRIMRMRQYRHRAFSKLIHCGAMSFICSYGDPEELQPQMRPSLGVYTRPAALHRTPPPCIPDRSSVSHAYLWVSLIPYRHIAIPKAASSDILIRCRCKVRLSCPAWTAYGFAYC